MSRRAYGRQPSLTQSPITTVGAATADRPRRPRGGQLARLRARVFAVYGYRCRDCGTDMPLEVHHVNGDPMDNRIASTIPLFRDCHHAATFPGI